MSGIIEKYNLGLKKLIPPFVSNGKTVVLGTERTVRVGSGGNNYFAWPDLQIDSTGKLHMVYYQGSTHNNQTDGTLVYQQGTWNEGTSQYDWSSPVTIVPDTSNAYYLIDPAIGITSTGRIIAFYGKESNPKSNNTLTAHFIFSDDGGNTWSPEQNFVNDIQYMADASGFVERNGVLYRPMYGRINGGTGNEYTRLYKSVDNGLTWTFVANSSSGASGFSLGENNIIFRSDGALICFMRGNVTNLAGNTNTGNGMYICWSVDSGLDWWSRPIRVANIFSKMQPAKFPSGTMVIVGRDSVSVLYTMYGYSNDGGFTWNFSRIDARNGENEYAGTVYDPFRNHIVSVWAVETGTSGQSPTSIFYQTFTES
jgi:hypothetical protein